MRSRQGLLRWSPRLLQQDGQLAHTHCRGGLRASEVRTPSCPQQRWLGGGDNSLFPISPQQGLLFFLSCLLGSSSSLFFLQKGRKANLEHSQLTCHRRGLGPVLGTGSLTVKRPRAGEPQWPALRNKEKEGEGEIFIYRPHPSPCHSPPPSRDSWPQPLLAPGRPAARAAPTCVHPHLCPPLPLAECVRKHPTLRGEKPGPAEIHAAACGRQRQEDGERTFSRSGLRQSCRFGERLDVFPPRLE